MDQLPYIFLCMFYVSIYLFNNVYNLEWGLICVWYHFPKQGIG